MSLAACVSRWPSTTRWPGFANALSPRNGSSTDACASLSCSSSGSASSRPSMSTIHARVPTLPDADHLARRVHVAVALQQPATVCGERPPVGADDAAHEVLHLLRADAGHDVLDRDDERWVADDPPLAVDDLGQLRERLQCCPSTVALATLRSNALRCFAATPLGGTGSRRRPDRSASTRRRGSTCPRTRAIASRYARATARLILCRSLVVEPTVATGHREARDEPLHVPLERTGQRLVEVVDAEDQPSIGRGERTEVREVGVAAELDLQTGAGRVREIGRHEVGGAAVERERGHEHPPVADRDQLGHARRVLLPEQLDRIAPADGRRHELAVSGSRRRLACGLALRRALGGARVVDRLGRAAPGPGPRLPGSVLEVRHGDITPPVRPRANHPFRAMSPIRRRVMVALR